ncbi:MAG: hypothetical protein ACOCXM_01355 [Myxococcota bacterium]
MRVIHQRHDDQRVSRRLSQVKGICHFAAAAYLLAIASALFGCGGGQAHGDAPSHDHFRAIQRAEARIASGQATVRQHRMQESPDCPTLCAGVTKVCEAAADLSAVARTLDDADARARERRGRDACREARGQAAQVCRCPGEDGR